MQFVSRTNVQLYCKTCGAEAKRALLDQSGCRGTRETASEPAWCPKGHGLMSRRDGRVQEFIDGFWVVTGREDDHGA
jgi:hypothetical protein